MKLQDHIFLFLSSILCCLVLSVFLSHIARYPQKVFSISPSIVISEIQISGTTADDEFVELYNPTGLPIDVSGWRLSRKTSATSSAITNLVSSMSGTIQPHHFFLITSPGYDGSSVSADLVYSATSSAITANNTILLFSDSGTTLVDKVGMGTANDKEGSTAQNPGSGQSIERKANSSSTDVSMQSEGFDELLGNGFDSDNNSNDFIVRIVSEAQNSVSQEEPISLPTPTNTPASTPTQTPTVTPLPTMTPTNEPTGTGTPTPTPSLTPTHEPTSTPVPTSTPTPSLEVTPTLTPSPTHTLTPSPTQTVTPTPIHHQFPRFTISCNTREKHIVTPWGLFSFPIVSCKLVKIL